CWRTREAVRRLVPRAATICSSAYPLPQESSARRRMRAWVSLRAAAFPLETICSKSARSSAVKVTRYLSIAVVLFSRDHHHLTAENQGTAFTCQMKMDDPLVRFAQGCSSAGLATLRRSVVRPDASAKRR